MRLISLIFITYLLTSLTAGSDTKKEPRLIQVPNYKGLEDNLSVYFRDIQENEPFVFELVDSGSFLVPYTPTDEDPKEYLAQQNKLKIPPEWIEVQLDDIERDIYRDGFTVIIHETVDDPHAMGDISVGRSDLAAIGVELNFITSSGFVTGVLPWILDFLVGSSFSPEVRSTRSISTHWVCPVEPGKSVGLRIYPLVAKLSVLTKRVKFSSKLKKFVLNFKKFDRHPRIKMFILTGMEDVECYYTTLGPNSLPLNLFQI